ncbi:hypothetical protein [Paenibacillus sp. FSL H7-0331]|uniref:hypothetical protein n=1 Tax=Paenibacillus sp. FSL H7-0331 TaxID=1920421 RepID=UPI00096C0F67|nr:hypothetical protein [Paenibacillus sp. FSL H7-0331]OME97376.1 hypothetical protein BK127_40555 [Paenibacillus sp. FSL H7-0331]
MRNINEPDDWLDDEYDKREIQRTHRFVKIAFIGIIIFIVIVTLLYFFALHIIHELFEGLFGNEDNF